jgi:hypothetical protein
VCLTYSTYHGSANKRLIVHSKKPSYYAVCAGWCKAQLETHSVTHSARHLARGTDIPIPLKITKPVTAKLPRMWLEFHPMCQMKNTEVIQDKPEFR